MLMYNFRKKYEFPRRSPGEKFVQYVPNFRLFFVVNHQYTEVMHKNGGVYTSCSPRLKIDHIWHKMFFANFAHFLQSTKSVRILMVCIIFVIFAEIPHSFRGGYIGKIVPFFTKCILFSRWLLFITIYNDQKWGDVSVLVTEGGPGFTLSEKIFRKCHTRFIKYCIMPYVDSSQYF